MVTPRAWPVGPRAAAIAHMAALVLLRALHDADDVSQWDLISFLNAQCAPLWDLLRRPEVHFLNPVSFPLYNVGAESAISSVLHKLFGLVSLYWSPVLVILVYDALFLFLVDRFFRQILEEERPRTWAWLLFSTSWVTLTFASTQAFNMQAYWPIVLALVGVEHFDRGEEGRGALSLALAFLFMSQGHVLSFMIPYYAAAWAMFRALACRRPRGLRSLVVVVVLALAANAASHGAYLHKISPLNPYDSGNVLADGGAVVSRATLFLRQSFWPRIRVDGVPIGFAPYFLYGAALTLGLLALGQRPGFRPRARHWLAGAAAAGLVAFGYAPSFLNPIVKSQRSIPGDLFLAAVVALGAVALVRRGALSPARVSAVLLVTALLSDVVYLRFTLAVDHTRNHSPLFDFDLSDGVIRHDMQAAVVTMKEQAEREGAMLVIVYPRGRSENTTDPAMFHARFLRHFGRFAGGSDVVFPCHFCDARYGCPFPSVMGRGCALTCCYEDPLPAIGLARLTGRRVFLWWWMASSSEAPSLSRDSLVAGLPGATFAPIALPRSVRGWQCDEIAFGGALALR